MLLLNNHEFRVTTVLQRGSDIFHLPGAEDGNLYYTSYGNILYILYEDASSNSGCFCHYQDI